MHGVGRALAFLSVYDRLGCDVIGLQKTRGSGHSAFSQADYLVYCSGECDGEDNGKKGQGGVGLAVRTSITRAARPPEFISNRLLNVTLELRGRAKAVTFFVAYAPTETQNASNKFAFWTTLDRAVEEVPKHEQPFVLKNTNARTRRREKGGVGRNQDEVRVETPKRKLSCRLRLMRSCSVAAPETDTRDAQLWRAVRKVYNWLKRLRSAAVVRFFERHVVELEKLLRMVDQHGFFQNIKPVQLEETRKVGSQCARDGGERLPRDKGRIRERWVRIIRSLLDAKFDMLDPDIPKRLPRHPVASALAIEPTEERISTAIKEWQTRKQWDRMAFPRTC